MPNLKNCLRPNGDKQHDLGRNGIRWNKLWVGDIDSNGALLSQNYVYETTYAEQIEFQGLLEVIFPTPPGQNFSLPSTLVKMTGVKVATAVLNSGLTHQFRLGAFHVYNRALNTSEILNNYNATKAAYGL